MEESCGSAFTGKSQRNVGSGNSTESRHVVKKCGEWNRVVVNTDTTLRTGEDGSSGGNGKGRPSQPELQTILPDGKCCEAQ